MDIVANGIADALRWATPTVGLVITALAWRRFKSPGAVLAMTAFALMLLGPIVREVIEALWLNGANRTAADVGLMLSIGGVIGAVGLIVLVVATRRLIIDASPDTEEVMAPGERELS